MTDSQRLRELVRSNPTAPEFVELASLLISEEATRPEGREVLFRALTAEPTHLIGRLLLAKSFYYDRMTGFCARELVELRTRVETPALDRLIEAFRDYVPAPMQEQTSPMELLTGARSVEEEVMGELELDVDFDDAEEDLKS